MSEQHPTIPGVTVEQTTFYHRPAVFLRMDEAQVFAESKNRTVEICTTNDICIDFYLDDARALGASIAYAVDWLEQEAGR